MNKLKPDCLHQWVEDEKNSTHSLQMYKCSVCGGETASPEKFMGKPNPKS